MFRIKFWGVRGSLPVSGPEYQEFGGTSCCVSIQLDDHFIIFDAGSGLYPLGRWLVENNIQNIHLFITHLHFDHVIGLPFFAPLWQSDFKINLYAGPHLGVASLQEFLELYMCPPLFPVPVHTTALAKLSVLDIAPGETVQLGNHVVINTIPLVHPGEAMGYRLNFKDRSVCYITDTEHLTDSHDQMVLEFVEETDCLIYDSTFDDQQFDEHPGWGHSTWREATYIAKRSEVKKLILYHHNPENNDEKIRAIEKRAQNHFPNTQAARQGMVFDLSDEKHS